MANTTIYPFGTGQMPSGIGVINDLTTGGVNKALSAEQGKVLWGLIKQMGGKAKSGTFGEAYAEALSENKYFLWILRDTVDGDTIIKPIWHVGYGQFVDAVGSTISLTATVPTFSPDGGDVCAGDKVSISFTGGILKYTTTANNVTSSVQVVGKSPCVLTIDEATSIEAWVENADGSSTHVTKAFTIKASVLSITTSAATSVTINGTSHALAQGENELPFSTTLSGTNTDEISTISFADVTLITAFDGHGAKFTGTELTAFNGAANLVTFKGLKTTSSLTGISFHNCSNLTSIDTSDFVTASSMTNVYFHGCSKLATLDVSMFGTSSPNTGSWFRSMTELRELKIGDLSGSTYIAQMFGSSTKIRALVCTTDTPPTIGSSNNWLANLFTNSASAVIYVPADKVDTYKSATTWNSYADKIKSIEEYL